MKQWNFYTSNEIKPAGWLKRQLEIQAEGLSGNLHKVWPDIRESAWIGGTAEGWERVPYWLDGFIPLAYLLEKEELITTAKKYIDSIIASQNEDGWICPCKPEERTSYDTWAVLLITKVLVVYYECSGDERIPEVIYKTLKNYHQLLSEGTIRLFDWGKYRWYEGFIAVNFLYERYQEAWILDLAKLLKEQGMDYKQVTELWKRPLNKWTFDTHIVNLAMMLKSECVSCELLGEDYTDLAEYFRTLLDQYNGTPIGLFTGDECLSGLSPIQGTELCAVVEQMYSYELLYAYTGNRKWAERLEVLAFNGLPATISDDMWTHQYDQLSNQIACVNFPFKPPFRTNGGDSILFGLEPNFGCCTANFNQGWPKLALSTFLHKDDEIISALPIPASLTTEDFTITLETNYPFENKLTYRIDAKKALVFKVRIPSFAENLTVNGQTHSNEGELTFAIGEEEYREICITFDTVPVLMNRPHDLKTVKCGSLVFSVPIGYAKKMLEYSKNGVERKFPYCDYEYIGTSDWNYAYAQDKFEIIRQQITEIPFSSQQPPVVLKASVQKIGWGFEDGYDTVCAKVPVSTTPIGPEETIELHPYGCAKLRMTEIPLVK